MKKFLIFAFCLGHIPFVFAASHITAKLQCSGTFSQYVQPNANNAPFTGMYVEISKDNVLISGSIGFDGNYRITNHPKSGVDFVNDDDGTKSGFINRWDGTISLVERSANDSDRIIILVEAKCKRAKAIF